MGAALGRRAHNGAWDPITIKEKSLICTAKAESEVCNRFVWLVFIFTRVHMGRKCNQPSSDSCQRGELLSSVGKLRPSQQQRGRSQLGIHAFQTQACWPIDPQCPDTPPKPTRTHRHNRHRRLRTLPSSMTERVNIKSTTTRRRGVVTPRPFSWIGPLRGHRRMPRDGRSINGVDCEPPLL